MQARLVRKAVWLGAAALVVAVVNISGFIALTPMPLQTPGARAGPATITVRVGDVWFCDPSGPQPCLQPHDTVINAGDTVIWEWGPGGSGTVAPHTTTHCADDFMTCSGPREWDSSPATTIGTFAHTFGPEDAGKTFLYRCQIHPSTMQGRIMVQAAPTPTPTPTATAASTATPVTTLTPTPIAIPTGTPAAEASATPAQDAPLAAGATLSATPSAATVPSAGGPPPPDAGNATIWVVFGSGAAIALGLAVLLLGRAGIRP